MVIFCVLSECGEDACACPFLTAKRKSEWKSRSWWQLGKNLFCYQILAETALSQAVKNTPTQIRVSLQRNLLTLLWHIYVLPRLFSCNNLELLCWHSYQPVPSRTWGRETKRCPGGLRSVARLWLHTGDPGQSESKWRFNAFGALTVQLRDWFNAP